MPEPKPNLQALIDRVQTAFNKAHGVKPRPSTALKLVPSDPAMPPAPKPERPAINEKVKAYLDKKYADDPDREQLCDLLLGCEVWPTEEILLEDLKKAKHGGDEQHIYFLRDLIHANSWSSHRPPPAHETFVRLAHKLHDDLLQEQRSRGKVELDEARELQSQVNESEVILEALRDGINDQEAEAATRGIEDWMDRAWHQLDFVKRSTPFDWKTHQELRKQRPQVRVAMQRIELLRQLRDQIYFQRLYPNLHHAAREAPNKPATSPHAT